MIGINVAQLLKLPQGAVRQCTLDEPASALGEPSVVSPVQGKVSLTRTGSGILVECQFETALSQECARCLEPTVAPVSGHFYEEFQPTVDVRTGVALSEAPDADAFVIGADHVLELGEAIRQYVLTAAPMRPLCGPDCQGLCPTCGSNRNQGACGCPPEDGGSPFHALRTLLDQPADQAQRA